jgi:hypothetical protein
VTDQLREWRAAMAALLEADDLSAEAIERARAAAAPVVAQMTDPAEIEAYLREVVRNASTGRP